MGRSLSYQILPICLLVMTLFRVEEYIHEQFAGTGVEIEVIKGQSMLEDMFTE